MLDFKVEGPLGVVDALYNDDTKKFDIFYEDSRSDYPRSNYFCSCETEDGALDQAKKLVGLEEWSINLSDLR